MNRHYAPSLWKGLAAGLLGGLAGSWTMNASQSLMSEIRKRSKSQDSEHDSSQQQQSSSEEPATVKAARAVSEHLFHHELRDDQKSFAGNVAHYTMGAASGAVYSAVTVALPAAPLARGLVFGTALWLIADEAIVPVFGFSKAPIEYPASRHGYAWASHLIFGVTADAVRRLALRIV
ncbi:MAG: hypothetical protein ACR2IV_00730 [Bryobacteraceae bacterium]